MSTAPAIRLRPEPRPDAEAPPYHVARPLTGRAPVLFTSPHSGSHYPETMLGQLRVPLIDLRRTEDAFVDELFAAAPSLGAVMIHASHGRAYVDLNRDARELDPAMFEDGAPRPAAVTSARVEAGLGCLPKIAARGEPIYAGQLTRADGERRLARVHDAYHERIQAEIARLTAQWGRAVLIDCHSMPSQQPGRKPLPDIVLGDRFGSSCHGRLTETAERLFRSLGFSVARNAPYAGGYTTRRYGRPRQGAHALQIELNRSLYMDEIRVARGRGFDRLRSVLTRVCEELIDLANDPSWA